MAIAVDEKDQQIPKKSLEDRPGFEVGVALFLTLLFLIGIYRVTEGFFGHPGATLVVVVITWFVRGAYDSPNWPQRWDAILQAVSPIADIIRAKWDHYFPGKSPK